MYWKSNCTQLRRLWGTPLEAVSSLAFFLSMLFQSSLFQFHCLEPCKVLTEFGFRHYAFCNWMPTNSWNELTPRLLPLQVLIWRCWYGNKNMNLKQTKKPEEEVPGWVHPTELISKSLISSGVLPGEEAAVWALHTAHMKSSSVCFHKFDRLMLIKVGEWPGWHTENTFTSLLLVLAENDMQRLVLAVTWGSERTTFKRCSNFLNLGCKGVVWILQHREMIMWVATLSSKVALSVLNIQ